MIIKYPFFLIWFIHLIYSNDCGIGYSGVNDTLMVAMTAVSFYLKVHRTSTKMHRQSLLLCSIGIHILICLLGGFANCI